MASFSVPLLVSNYCTRESETIAVEIHPQATFSKIPASLLERLGVEQTGRQPLPAVNGAIASFPVGYVLASLTMSNGESAGSIIKVAFGPEDECSLGRLALHSMAVELDPESQRLVPLILPLPTLIAIDETGTDIY